MIPPSTLDTLQAAIRAALPPQLAEGLDQNLRAALSAALERLDLVTREEWEIQRMVLARSREKLERLERLVSELEQRLPKKAEGSADERR